MPLYEYACAQCGHELEARQRISEPPLTKCPKCGAEALERLVSQTSFTLKGGGWYADGYGGSTPGGSTTASSKSSASSAASTSSSSSASTSSSPSTTSTSSSPSTTSSSGD